eukprot:1635322-Amphidinium_carterae.1
MHRSCLGEPRHEKSATPLLMKSREGFVLEVGQQNLVGGEQMSPKIHSQSILRKLLPDQSNAKPHP